MALEGASPFGAYPKGDTNQNSDRQAGSVQLQAWKPGEGIHENFPSLQLGNAGETCEKTPENLVGEIANISQTELVSLSDRSLEGDWRH